VLFLSTVNVKNVLYSSDGVVLAADVSEAELAAIPETVQAITLPEKALRPLRTRKFAPVVKNEVIEALVENVNIANIRSTLDHLSNGYTTRQSQSAGAVASGAWIESEFEGLGLGTFTFKHRADHSDNVCGQFDGVGNELVMIGAHYDCRNTNSGDSTGRAPGADDNGSGTATIMEIARGIVASGLRFRYSLQFCVWSGEEQGLLGSRYYASELADNNTDIVAYLNADMVGFNPGGIGAPPVITFMSGSASRTLNTFLEEVANQYVPGVEVSRTNACCSDQQSFYENGYESAGYFEHDLSSGAGAYSCYHRECDTIDKIDFEQVEIFAKAIMAGFATLAEPL